MKKLLLIFIVLAFTFGTGYILVKFYSYVFAVEVEGKIVRVERVTSPTAILGEMPTSQIYSYAVAIKKESGEIYTASSEDRQWSIATEGQCVTAKFFPYPPWDFDKGGTYFGARLIKLKECM